MAKTSGGQKGNNNATKSRPWAEALNKALKRKGEGDARKLDLLADKVVEIALDGDMQAVRECADRLDGKALATIEMKGEIDVTEYRGLSEVSDRIRELTRERADRDLKGSIPH